MSQDTMFTLSPAQVYEEITVCAQGGVVPIIVSSPGVGKSSIVHQFADDNDLELIDVRVAQCTPEDLQGFPMRNGNKAEFVPFDMFPIEGDELPEGKNGWCLFLDEITSANKSVQAAAYKIVLDRKIGSHNLHSNVVIVAAGNKASDRAVVNQMSTALQSRMTHYELAVDHKAWMKWAIESGIDHRIIGYLGYMPERLMDFRPDHQDKTFPCPRTWEFLSRLIKDREVSEKVGARICGTIGEGVGTDFLTYAKEYDKLPHLADIVKDPKGMAVPAEMSTKYATISMLMQATDESQIEPVLDYVEKFDIELRIIFFRGFATRFPMAREKSPKFLDHLMKMARFLQ